MQARACRAASAQGRFGSQAAPLDKGREDGGNEIGKKQVFMQKKASFHMKPLIFNGGLLTTFKTHFSPPSDFPLI